MSIEQRLVLVEAVLKEQGSLAAAAVARSTAVAKMLVEKGVCTWDELRAMEGQALREWIEANSAAQPGAKVVEDPKPEPIIKPN